MYVCRYVTEETVREKLQKCRVGYDGETQWLDSKLDKQFKNNEKNILRKKGQLDRKTLGGSIIQYASY
jgi:hypothetical protein